MEPRLARILIVGNSGSGKSWLAARLAQVLRCGVVDLDSLHWEPSGYDIKRDKDDAVAMTRHEAQRPQWIIEGVYGWLAIEAMPRATMLVWLDLPVSECVANVEHRGARGGATEAAFAGLLAWTAAYADRETSSSLSGHARLFADFEADRVRLTGRAEIERWMVTVMRGAIA